MAHAGMSDHQPIKARQAYVIKPGQNAPPLKNKMTTTQKDVSAPALIDRKQLAARWTTSIPTIKRREKEGLLDPVHLSKRLVRYRLADIEAIEASNL